MTKIKDKLIKEKLSKPLEIGDDIEFTGEGNGSQNKNWWAPGTVVGVSENTVNVRVTNGQTIEKDISKVKQSTFYIGVDPFPEKDWRRRLRMVNFTLESIVYTCGYDKNKRAIRNETLGDVLVPEINYSPFVIGANGIRVPYQRGFVWSLKDNQLLIDSIYNNIDIGKIVLRKRSWEWVRSQVEQGIPTAFKDVVDGKQRLNAILSFLDDGFKDSQGNYWSDLSDAAQNKFLSFSAVAYGELDESCTDEDTLDVFLGVNFTGVPMSQEHIDFVREINLK
jgi:hypothetical protein